MRLELTQKLQQQQILAPQMILSMDILLLTAQELEARIEKELSENPALEIREVEPDNSGTRKVESSREKSDPTSVEFEKLASLESQYPARFREDAPPRRPRSEGGNDKHEMLQNTQGKPPGLKDYLLEQIHLKDLSSDIRDVAEEIIQNLDQRGYLGASADEIFSSLDGRCDRTLFESALDTVRGLDPAGVGAVDLKECLLLQLERDRQQYPLETSIILNHLEDLGNNKLPKIAKDLGATLEDIKDAVDIITALDPLPGSRYESSPTMYVRPEVIVEDHDGRLEVRIDDDSVPPLTISEHCRQLLKEYRGKTEVTSFVRKKIESAQWLMHAVRQRHRTLYDIAVAIVEYQREFMERGPQHLRAMRMQTIADIVRVHISTISRAIKGKYMETPWGVYEMRFFFTGGVATKDGELESRRNIYRRISEIIEKEDKKRPYSDSEIAQILSGQGLAIARRTVTKYREQENIPSSRVRRSY